MNAVEAAGLTKRLFEAKRELQTAGAVTRIAITGTILELRKKLGAWKRVQAVLDRLAANPFDESKNLKPAEYVEQVKAWLPDSLICFKKAEAGNAKGIAHALAEVLGRYPELANSSEMKLLGTGAELLAERKKQFDEIERRVDEMMKTADVSRYQRFAAAKFDGTIHDAIQYRRWRCYGNYNLAMELAKNYGVQNDKRIKAYVKDSSEVTPEFLTILREVYVRAYAKSQYFNELKYTNPKILKPEVSIPKFRGMDKSERAYAYCAYGYGVIMTSHFRKNLTNSVKRDESESFHPQGTLGPDSQSDAARSVIAHELGHSMDAMLNLQYNAEILDLWKTHKKTMRDDLSRYAGTNVKEMIAEAFSEYMLSKAPRPLAQKIGQIIDNEYARRFGE